MKRKKIYWIFMLLLSGAILIPTNGINGWACLWAGQNGAPIVFAPVPEGEGHTGGKVKKNKNTGSIISSPIIPGNEDQNQSNNPNEAN